MRSLLEPTFGALLGALGPLLGGSWASLGRPWSLLGPSDPWVFFILATFFSPFFALLGALGPHLGHLALIEPIFIAFLSIFIDFWYQNSSQNRSKKLIENRCQILLNFVRNLKWAPDRSATLKQAPQNKRQADPQHYSKLPKWAPDTSATFKQAPQMIISLIPRGCGGLREAVYNYNI